VGGLGVYVSEVSYFVQAESWLELFQRELSMFPTVTVAFPSCRLWQCVGHLGAEEAVSREPGLVFVWRGFPQPSRLWAHTSLLMFVAFTFYFHFETSFMVSHVSLTYE
jgi:hypothetical protein